MIGGMILCTLSSGITVRNRCRDEYLLRTSRSFPLLEYDCYLASRGVFLNSLLIVFTA